MAEERWSGAKLDRAGRPDLAALIRAIDGRVPGRPRAGRPSRGSGSSRRTRGISRTGSSRRWPSAGRSASALHLPVQSGSDSVLRRMGRQYSIAHYDERLARLRAAVPGIAISTDVIVGFCGETDEQYEATLDLLRRVRYDQVFAGGVHRPAGDARDAARRRRAAGDEAGPAQRAPRRPGDGSGSSGTRSDWARWRRC